MGFHLGQKVVCIANGTWKKCREQGLSVPVKNGIYTIRELTFYGIEGLRLAEIINPPRDYEEGFHENAWAAFEFRPLEEKKTDISIFRKILEDA